ncbi:hypothetical protein [Halorhabdus rudnickae]|uniref:hypothetical protein n=1 Tax=Halorhabdus rudnickae TaxID=1775544 RepID=UPI0010843778|nr:hypothetical protein [Halorhabdus rudnickae]
MAVIISAQEQGESSDLVEQGVVIDGEYYGNEDGETMLPIVDLDEIDEKRLAASLNSHYVKATIIPDEEVDIEKFRQMSS